MSSPTTPKALPVNPVSSSSSPETPQPRREYNRRVDASFGDRLANARRLSPAQAPPPPPPRLTTGSFEGSIYPPSLGSELSMSSDHYDATHIYTLNASSGGRVASGIKIGTEKGSYKNPYDYPSNEVLGSKGLSYIRQYGNVHMNPQYPLLDEMRSVGVPETKEQIAVAPKREIKVPAGAVPRSVVLGPLRMIRSQCEDKEALAPVLDFLDDAMPIELQTPLSYDNILPKVVYSVSIPMTDKDWANYQNAVAVFPRVAAFSDMLAIGEIAFNQVTAVHPTAPMLSQGLELEDLLAILVKRHRLGVSWNVMRPWEKPGQKDWKYPI